MTRPGAPSGSWPGPHLDGDQRMLAELVDSLTAELGAGSGTGTVAAGTGAPASGGASAALRDALLAQGVWTLGMPEDLGGGAAGLSTTLLAVQRLGRADPALALAMVHAHAATTVLAGRSGWRATAEEVAAGASAGVLDGHGGGADLTLSEDAGDGSYRLAGTVDRLDAGPEPAVLVVLDPHGAPGTAAVVPAAADGVALGAPEPCTGLAGVASRPAAFRDCRLGTAGAAAAPTGASRQFLHLGYAAVAGGLADAAACAAARYVAEREQFGRPLAALAVIQEAVGAAAANVRAVLHTVFGIARGEDPLGPRSAPDCALASRDAVRGAVAVTTAAVQLHGGYGYLAEYQVEGMLRDAVSLRAAAAALARPGVLDPAALGT